MLMLNDGRSELWQWDTGRKLSVDADLSQVHFSNKVFGRSIDMPVIDGVVEVPDFLLQTDKDLNAWAFVGTAENGYTKISKVFKVNKRNKPADYVFTPIEQTTLAEIKERLDDLEAMQDPDAIKNAVDDYLANNPIVVEETDPTVPDWAKQPEPPKVVIPQGGGGAIQGVHPFEKMKATLIINKTITKDETGALPAKVSFSEDDNGNPLELTAFALQSDIKSGYSYTEFGINRIVGNASAARGFHPIRKTHGKDEIANAVFVTETGLVIATGPARNGVVLDSIAYEGNDYRVREIVLPYGGGFTSGTFVKVWKLSAEE